MKVLSLNVGLPRKVDWHGQTVLTSIFKEPIDRRLRVTPLNVEGDAQSDLTVHGGIHKAVYAYPSEHYAFWRRELPGMDLPWAIFGENLTTEGLLEDVRIGDRFRIGSAELVVTQPRLPCFKLGIRFGRPDILKRLLKSGHTGFYFSVAVEGEVGAGDTIEQIGQGESLTVADVVGLYSGGEDQELLLRASESAILPEGWKDYFRKRLGKERPPMDDKDLGPKADVPDKSGQSAESDAQGKVAPKSVEQPPGKRQDSPPEASGGDPIAEER
jgi:MOSC domain-containing protein YiiM